MRARIAFAAALAAGAVLLAGCGETSSATSDYAVPDAAIGEMAPEAAAPEARAADGSGGSTAVTTQQRQVIRTGTLALRADDVAATVTQIRSLTAAAKGFVSSESTSTSDDYAYSSITVQIPADGLDAFVEKVSALGTVLSVDVSAQDVTSQTVDLDARIDALQASVDRMTELMGQASDVSDLMTIEAQLSQRQAELDALRAQRSWLGEQVAMSTLSVSVQPVTTVEPVQTPGFGAGLENGWAALVSTVGVGATVVGFFLPFLVLLVIVGVPVVLLSVWLSRRHKQRTAERTAALHAAQAQYPPQPPPQA